jgi:hypothetical protein
VYESHATVTVNSTAVASGQASGTINLAVGGNTITVAVTAHNGVTKKYIITVTRESESPSSPSPDTDRPSGPSVGDQENQTGLNVSINGKQYENVANTSTTEEGGKTALKVNAETDKLKALIDKEGDKPEIVIPVTKEADKVDVVLTGDAVKLMETKKATLQVETPNGNYKLPAAEVLIDEISKQLGEGVKLSDIIMHVNIEKSDFAKVKLIENTAEIDGFTVVVPPVDFTVTATYNGKTVEVEKFSNYVQREIPLPDGVDPSKVTTAAIMDKDGTVRHVPTRITNRDGKYYAVVSSLTNSDYSLIWHLMTFADVEGHWAKDAVNDMASRMIVNGIDASRYNPNAAITRAEFAAIIVRALGLADEGTTAAFQDVKSGDWYVGAVAKAQEYGIVEGYEDGTFRPAKMITREDAMVMIARAMKLAGLETSVSGAEAEAALVQFADGSAVDAWAKQSVAAVVKHQLVNGSNAGLMPTSDITRAETAAIVQRMLVKANLIDSRNSK